MSKKKLTITVEYTDNDPDEYQVLKEQLEWVMDGLSITQQYGYNDYQNAMGEIEVVTYYKIEDNE